MNKIIKITTQMIIVFGIGTLTIWVASLFSEGEKETIISKEVIVPAVIECPNDFSSYEEVKKSKNVILLEKESSFGRENGSFKKSIVSINRKGLNSQIACGYLFYRVSVGDRAIQREWENFFMRPTNSQFGGHILPDKRDLILDKDINNKTEMLIPLNSVSYNGTDRRDIKRADWVSLLNVSDKINFEIALNTTSELGYIDSVEMAYKCWNPKTGLETNDCELEIAD